MGGITRLSTMNIRDAAALTPPKKFKLFPRQDSSLRCRDLEEFYLAEVVGHISAGLETIPAAHPSDICRTLGDRTFAAGSLACERSRSECEVGRNFWVMDEWFLDEKNAAGAASTFV